MTAAELRALPKVELHCHLDACVRVQTVVEIGRELALNVPDPPRPALVAPDVCFDLRDYLRRIDLALDVLQRPQDLQRVAFELVEDMAADGVIYAEVRFAPQLHTRRGLSPQGAIDAVRAGLEAAGARHGVATGLIVCCLRHQSAAESLAVAELAAANHGVVCALDLAGDEAGHRAARHAPAFELARQAGVRLTAHAGEAAGAWSVREALDVLGAERIGHGVRIEEDRELVARLAEEQVPLDMCPRSNVQTRAVASWNEHPVDRLFRRGLRVTVSTDARTVSDTDLTRELLALGRTFGWTLREAAACQASAARAAFVPAEVRERLLARIGV